MARIAFFGTPEFSEQALRLTERFCREKGHTLALVITQPDRKQGRGQMLQAPPVKTLALKLGLSVMQPDTLKKNTEAGEQFFSIFSNADIDLAIVVAYGKLIPKRILSAVSLNFINIHGSLLPSWRGAAPIQRALEYGDKETGVCLMEMNEKLDEGDILVSKKTPIISSDNASTLFRRLSFLGARLLYENLDFLLRSELKKFPQPKEGASYAPMIEKGEAALSFEDRASLIAHKARAFDPWPGLFAYIHNKRVQFFDSFFINSSRPQMSAGTIVSLKPFLGVKAIDGIVYFQHMQIEGKKVQAIKDAVAGLGLKVGDIIQTRPSSL